MINTKRMGLRQIAHTMAQVTTLLISAGLLLLPGARTPIWVGVWCVAAFCHGLSSVLFLRGQGLMRSTPREMLAKARERRLPTIPVLESLTVALAFITAVVLALR